MKTRPLLPHEARQLNISWVHAIGIKDNSNAGREFVTTNSFLSSGTRNIAAVRITRAYNLGNHIRQVVNAIRFAEMHDIRAVLLPENSPFSDGQVGAVEIVRDKANGSQWQHSSILSGTFFYFRRLGIEANQLERGRVITALRDSFDWRSAGDVSDSTLTIHLRAGDSFDSSPHPLYAPPPLSFFLGSIDAADASKVSIVAQSMDHPYVASLQSYCDERAISFEVISSDLQTDFGRLLSSSSLCISQGTLGIAAGWLSTSCNTIYAYERNSEEIATTTELGIETVHAKSTTRPQAWKGSDDQFKQLMDISTPLVWDQIR